MEMARAAIGQPGLLVFSYKFLLPVEIVGSEENMK